MILSLYFPVMGQGFRNTGNNLLLLLARYDWDCLPPAQLAFIHCAVMNVKWKGTLWRIFQMVFGGYLIALLHIGGGGLEGNCKRTCFGMSLLLFSNFEMFLILLQLNRLIFTTKFNCLRTFCIFTYLLACSVISCTNPLFTVGYSTNRFF